MNPVYSKVAEAADIVEARNPQLWKLVCPRRYVPPNGYANPRINSCLMAVHMRFQFDEKPNKVEIDCILSTWKILESLAPTIFVGKEFAESLALTEPPQNLKISELNWPFLGMTFVLPEAFQKSFFGCPVPFLRVATHPTGYQNAPAIVKKVYPMAPRFGIDEAKFDENCFIVSATVMYGEKPIDYTASFSDKAPIGEMMSDQVYADFTYDSSTGWEEDIQNTIEGDKTLLRKMIAMAAHLLLAMNAVPEHLEQPSVIRPIRIRGGEVVRQELWTPHFFGRTYTWHRDKDSQGGNHASPRLHPRRGHWRHQPFGTGRTENKIIWIKPMLIGAKTERTDDAEKTKTTS